MYFYKCYDLTFATEMEFPEFSAVSEDATENPDITIKYGKVDEDLPFTQKYGVCYQLGPEALLLDVENIARYLSSYGKYITINKYDDAEEDAIRSFIFDVPISGIMHQRGMLPLYGAAIEKDGFANVICGISGTGKSTIAYEFIKRGYKILSDDITVLMNSGNGLDVLPGYPSLRLPLDVLKRDELKIEDYPQIRKGILQKRIPIPSKNFYPEKLPLRKVYIVSSWNKNEVKKFDLEENYTKFNLLHDSMHRQYLSGMGSGFSLVKITAQLMSNTPAAQIVHTRIVKEIKETVDMIEEDMGK
jgi:hypothetical protein